MKATIIYSKMGELPRDDSGDPRNETGLVDKGRKLGPPSTAVAICTCGVFRSDDPSLYEVAAEVETDSDTEADCGSLFERFNIGDHGGERIRSMSVGDVIVFGSDRTFVVQGMGWKEVDNGPAFLRKVQPTRYSRLSA